MPTEKSEIFISYRRLDSAVFSQWLATQLRAAYGQHSVFIDTESIRDAEVWAPRVQGALHEAEFVIVVIGKSWLSISDEVGRRRIDLADDWVRREIEVSLKEGKNILPLLIDGAELPAREAVPPSIAKLIDIQARRIATEKIGADIADIVNKIAARLRKQPIAVDIQYPFPLLKTKIKPLDDENLRRLANRLTAWSLVSRLRDNEERIELMRKYEFEKFEDAIHFMNTASRFIDRIDHHPEWTNIWRTLVVYLTTWDIEEKKPTMLDVDLATYLDELYKNYERKIDQRDLR